MHMCRSEGSFVQSSTWILGVLLPVCATLAFTRWATAPSPVLPWSIDFSHIYKCFFIYVSKFPEALSLLAILTSVMVHFNISTHFSYILVFSSILCFKTLSRYQSCILLMLSQLPPVYFSFSILFLLVFLKITDYVGVFVFWFFG